MQETYFTHMLSLVTVLSSEPLLPVSSPDLELYDTTNVLMYVIKEIHLVVSQLMCNDDKPVPWQMSCYLCLDLREETSYLHN